MPTLSQRSFFGSSRPVVITSAPGRLDVMGGIADYSGSLVLEMPIRERAAVTAARRFDGLWRVYSAGAAKAGLKPLVQAKTQDLFTPEKAKSFFEKSPKGSWAAYVLGAVPLLMSEKDLLPGGADLYLESNVPLAKGLSSSAAVEVAALSALGELFGIKFKGTELPTLCQKVENLVAGAPCGLMDQLTCYLGKKSKLLPILCQPDKVQAPVTVPKGIQFIGIDSGVRHWVGGSSYSEVRTAAFMGYSLIALREGAKRKDLQKGKETGDSSHLPFGGYLANISPSHFESRFVSILPREMKGRDFLRLCPSMDRVTEVHPKKNYQIRACAQHPIYENDRVQSFKQLLISLGKTSKPSERRGLLLQMGHYMYESHESYGDCGLGEPVTDALVEAARQAGPKQGIYGAKITGGGSGGTVCLLAEGKKGLKTAKRVAAKTVKGKPFIALGSSDGGRWT